jgi:hypothetical protein
MATPKWRIVQKKLFEQNQKTTCGKLGGKHPTKKSCPSQCNFIDMGSGGTLCKNPTKRSTKRSTKTFR